MMLSASIAFAQKTVTGTVIDGTTGEPVIGASVLVDGTSLGAATDVNGKFSIANVPNSAATVRVSYIGMKTQQVAISPNMKVTLESDAQAIDDVIVVGYGTTRREAKTGSVVTVKGDEIADIPASSIDKMLSGKMAGVQITSQTGQPGANSNIMIRGISSINAGTEPLWVVDGIPVMNGDQSYFTNTNNALAAINPDDIESITVLKDAAATSVYGSRAANGVILVTTKSGKAGKSQISVHAKYGVSSFANDNDYRVMNPSELLGYMRQAVTNAGKNPDDPTGVYYSPMSLLTGKQTNWMKEFTRNGSNQEYEINLQGGNDRTTYYSSVSYHKNEGVFKGVDFSRIQARINADHQINNHWKTGTRINVAYMKQNDTSMQDLYYANPAFAGLTILPWTPLYDENGEYNTNIPENSNTNPLSTVKYDDQWEKQYRFNGNMYLEYKPIKEITLRSTNSIELTFNQGRRYWSQEAHNFAAGYPELQTSDMKYQLITTSNTATYENIFNDNHSVRFLLGQEANKYTNYYDYGISENLNPNIPYHINGNATNDLAYSENTYTLASFFGILDYNYAAKYYLQASARWDGCSKFGKNNKWGFFWSLGLSWNMHNEKFMQDIDWVNLLKLRASYGVNGNNNISNYQQYGVYASAVYNGITGMIPGSPANDGLSWERNNAWNFGLDFTLFGKLSGSFDVYTRKTEDMLLWKTLSATSGFGSALMNIGSLRNSGVEFQLDYKVIDNKDWTWSVGGNIAANKSKILDLGDDEMLAYDGDSRLRHIKGERLYTFWLKDYYGVNPVNGEALWKTEEGELTNDFNKAAWVKSGSPEPKFTGGLNTNLRWKDLTLSVVCEFKGGNKILIIENRYLQGDGSSSTMSMNQAASLLNYWKKPGDTGCNPKPIAGNSTNSYSYSSNRFIEDGSYFRIKDITLSYNMPQQILKPVGINAAKVYLSALNLYTFHDVNFWDPERGVDGMGYGIYPMSKTFVVGVDVAF